MNSFVRLSSYTWITALIAAGGFLLWIDAAMLQRVEYVSRLAEPAVVVDATSPTGYASGLRRLIVPLHNNQSYQWIAQTQQMLARGEAHVRHVDYDNAPSGREVRTPSPYRWWLGLVAWCDHVISGRSLGQAVERAAVFADPALQLLLLIAGVGFTLRQFGVFPATLLALGWAILFPFAGTFLDGQPGDGGLAHACAFWSVLPLVAGFESRCQIARTADEAVKRVQRQRWLFLVAGVAGGIGLWVNVPCELPLLGGTVIGGLLAGVITRHSDADTASTTVTPWRIWALAGAATTLVAYVVEYYPTHFDWQRLETIHPLFGLGWIGAGELLHRASAWRRNADSRWSIGQLAAIAFAVVLVVAIPAAIRFTGSNPFTIDDAFASSLSNLPDGPAAPNLWSLLMRDGFTFVAAATFLPLLLVVPAIWLLLRERTRSEQRAAIALAVGPVVVALGLACFQLSWWSVLGGLLLTLLVATAATADLTAKAATRWAAVAGVLLLLGPGAILLSNPARAEKPETLTAGDVISLIERDLAYWLSNQAGPAGAVVLAPPSLTTSLYFHGGLAGLGTPYWENKDGFSAAVRLAGATSPDEAQAIAQAHHLTYIVIPSWDPFLDEYARLGSREPERSLVALLHQWLPPRWLRPVPYHVPKIAGFEGLSVAVFQVTDVQDNPTALGRLAEYFLEMEQLDQAAQVAQALGRLFPSDVGALVSRALVDHAEGNAAGFAVKVNQLASALDRGEEEALPWDRRVSLTVALAEGKRFDLAKEQTKQCLAAMDEAGIRSLTTLSVYRLRVLAKAFDLPIADPNLRALSQALLPAEMRAKL